ncbi:flagellar hook assembly protein FlgD [Alkalicoccus urumqiensis]|uniref:Flagellar hook assembly protein FlgD n=1 Tax=Alkalicoccus urumqiensis TaxID=1548213 RepID=A0A2P6MG20_ALKUR|nr:flagellar hook assembly protein FlgD [Alkalicoccus urumqiensis]PRO65226.1 flagellar hook assembly protein FlgD [Alkalicoccus urumqiensis]
MPEGITSNSQTLSLEEFQKQQKNNRASQNMDRDAFLKLLMTQLQNQDPLEPMDDKEFVAQMAQFSSLEQMTNLNETVQKFTEEQKQNQFVSHSDLIGRQVMYEAGSDEEPEIKESLVTSVAFKDGKAELILESGDRTSVNKVTLIQEGKE